MCKRLFDVRLLSRPFRLPGGSIYRIYRSPLILSFSLSLRTKCQLLESSINNKLYFFAHFSHFSRRALCHFSRMREQAGLEENIYYEITIPFARRTIKVTFSLTRRMTVDDFIAYLSFSRVPCFRCFGNHLILALMYYKRFAIPDNLPRHCSTTMVSPVFSSVSSSSFSSIGDQLRVTCASAGRTRSWPRVMDNLDASDCTWPRKSCRRHKRLARPTRVTARVAAARSSSILEDRSSDQPGRPSDGRRTTLADPSAPPRICRRSRSLRQR